MIEQLILRSKEETVKCFALEMAALIGLSGEGILDEIVVTEPGNCPALEIDYGKFNLEDVGMHKKVTINEESYLRGLQEVAETVFGYKLGQVPEFKSVKSPDHGLFTEVLVEDELFVREGKLKIYGRKLADEFLNFAALAVARLSMDANTIQFPVVTEDVKEATLFFQEGEKNRMLYEDGIVFEICDANSFKQILLNRNLEKTKFLVGEMASKNSFEWQFIKAYAQSREVFIEPTTREIKKLYESAFEDVNLRSYKEKWTDDAYHFTYPWEREVFLEKLHKLSQNSKKIVAIEGALSEPKSVRDELKIELMDQMGLTGEQIQLINSYKQGFSWIEEIILPKLMGRTMDRIDIAWTPFQKEDEEWTTEAGAVPTYSNTDINNHGRWYDLPIRHLQELYPIDDVLSRDLNLDRNKIEFPMEAGDYAYAVRAYCGGEMIFEEHLQAIFSERHYLDAYPGMGLVHPSTAYLKVIYEDGSESMEIFPTDLENIWSDYQSILMELGEEIESRKRTVEDQPFFAELHMDMILSEDDRRLGVREDMISSIDGFHEDLYFTGLDYFKVLGEQLTGTAFDAPGLILPEIHNQPQAPEFVCEIRRFLDHKPFAKIGEERVYLEMAGDLPRILGFEMQEDEIYLILESGLSSREEAIFKQILEIGGSLLSELDLTGVRLGDELISLGKAPKVKGALPNLETKVYDYQDSEVNLEFLSERAEVSYLGQSFFGRKIRGLDLIKPGERFESVYRSGELRPSLYINARHHANEVSSTNAVFILTEKVLAEPALLDKLNLVILPMENPDGSEIHAKLMEEHPYWIYHIARFNALGKEFSLEYFKDETIHTEALPLTHIFHRHLPDVYIDNHGVPTHEWNQQFSGYTAPAYKGFWLPRSLLYGYFWYPEGEEWKKNYDYAKAMEDKIADGINSHETMRELNLEWKDRFEKYAHQWMPKMFPTGYYKDMIFYWIGFEAERTHRYLSIRYPEITVVGYTSEVIDETAQDEHLTRCVHAQYQNNLSAMELMASREIEYDKIVNLNHHHLTIYRKRRRI